MSAKKIILLIDDNKHLLVTMGDYLRYQGFEVETAISGEAALKKLRTMVPDLIILDISMPGMGGVGFLKEISDAGGTPEYPVLVFTARAAMRDFFGNVDVAGFLDKGASEKEVLAKVREIVGGKPSEPSADKRDVQVKVFLAEPEEEAREKIADRLKKSGYEVETAATGTEALERVPRSQADVIVLREKLPKMTGSSAAALLHVMPSTATLPVLLYENVFGGSGEDRPAPEGVKRYLSTNRPAAIAEAVTQVVSA